MEKTLSFYISFVFALLLFPAIFFSQDKGYHGNIELGYSLNPNNPTVSVNWTEINTIHGYQFNPYVFVGGGIGLHFLSELKSGNIDGIPYWKRDASTEVPVFADVKLTFLKKKIYPFIDLRIGKYLTNDSGLYESIGLGCNFSIKKQAVYMLVSYTTGKFKFQELYMNRYDSELKYYDFDSSQSMLSIKVGYSF